MRLAFIGGGNMAASLIAGLISQGQAPQSIWVSEPLLERRQALQQQYGVQVTDSNSQAVEQADWVVLAVKPQLMAQVCQPLKAVIRGKAVISIAAGIRVQALKHWLGQVRLVRTMPNTPALLGLGMTGLYAEPGLSSDDKAQAQAILSSVGQCLWVADEAELDAVTAISGSGPAYFFLVMQAIEQSAQAMGFSAEAAALLTRQTALGAAQMAKADMSASLEQLRLNVTSKGGTTERAIASLQQAGLEQVFAQALQAARLRSVELSELLGG